MHGIEKLVIAILLTTAMQMVVPCHAAEEPSDKFSDYYLIKKCPSVARRYVIGDKNGAQEQAKELLPKLEQRYRERHNANTKPKRYDFGSELEMVQAVIRDDQKSVEHFMDNGYRAGNIEFEGFKYGLKEALAVHERALALIAADPLTGKSSSQYMLQGRAVAAMMYATGQIHQAKVLASELLSLIPQLKAEAAKKTTEPIGAYTYETEETVLTGITKDAKTVVSEYLKEEPYTDDSIGARLEEGYGKIYLYKRLKMDFDHLPYAYNYLGWAQALAGNYDESERAYKTALRLAKERYDHEYPEIPLRIQAEYAAMLKVAGKAEQAAKMSADLTPARLAEVNAKARHEQTPHIQAVPPGWGP